MSYVLDRRLTIPSWGIAIFAVALMAPMPATPVLALLVVAALLVTTRGVRRGATMVQTRPRAQNRRKGSLQTLVMVAAARANAPVSLEVRRAHAADLARMDDDGGRPKSRRMTSRHCGADHRPPATPKAAGKTQTSVPE
jgi:hypothetical protein